MVRESQYPFAMFYNLFTNEPGGTGRLPRRDKNSRQDAHLARGLFFKPLQPFYASLRQMSTIICKKTHFSGTNRECAANTGL
jgi:hypothetical protein